MDKEIFDLIKKEQERQERTIELIASENFVSNEILQAQGSILTNKYAEGYPQKRYYGGCEIVDEIESIAINRAKKLFNAEHANVQAHSGSQANMAVYNAILEKGDKVMGLALDHGGHLTHGLSINFSGKNYEIIPYYVDKKTKKLDYEQIRKLALENKPKLIIAGASAYPHSINFEKFSKIAKEVNAYFMVDMAHIAGLVAAGLHQNPAIYADFVTSTTHKTLRGPRSGFILCKEKYKKIIDRSIFPGLQGGPLMHVIAAKAICFKDAMSSEFIDYQKNVIKNAKAMINEFKKLGYDVVGDNTDTHLFMLDLTNLNISGQEVQEKLDQIGITLNKNKIPFDQKSAVLTSGIRIGTPAMTTKGFDENLFIETARLIDMSIKNKKTNKELIDIKNKILRKANEKIR